MYCACNQDDVMCMHDIACLSFLRYRSPCIVMDKSDQDTSVKVAVRYLSGSYFLF